MESGFLEMFKIRSEVSVSWGVSEVVIIRVLNIIITVKPHLTAISLIWPPHYYGHFFARLAKTAIHFLGLYSYSKINGQGPVVLKLDYNALNWINHHLVQGNTINGFPNTCNCLQWMGIYPVESAIQRLSNWGLIVTVGEQSDDTEVKATLAPHHITLSFTEFIQFIA